MEKRIPQNWVKVSLGEVVSKKKGKKPDTTVDYAREGYQPYILIHEMEGGIIRKYTNDKKVPTVEKDEVLLVWDGSIGKCSSGIKGAIGSTLVAIKPLGGIPTKFLEYFIMSKNNYILNNSTGTGLQHINKNFFKDCVLKLPPLAEQQRIVTKLNRLFEQLEVINGSLDKIPILLKNFRQQVLTQAVTGKLTESLKFKEKWNECTLGSLAENVTSGSRGWAKYYSIEGSKFIRAQNIKTNSLDLNDVAYVNVPNSREGKRTLINIGDILITITGANVTRTAWIENDLGEAYVSQHVGLLRLQDPSYSKFIHLFLKSDFYGRKQLLNAAYGQGKPQLNLQNIKDVKINLPGITEKDEIIRRVDSLFDKADKIQEKYKVLKAKIEQLPQAILHKAFKGELVPQLESDGDARKLLREIEELRKK